MLCEGFETRKGRRARGVGEKSRGGFEGAALAFFVRIFGGSFEEEIVWLSEFEDLRFGRGVGKLCGGRTSLVTFGVFERVDVRPREVFLFRLSDFFTRAQKRFFGRQSQGIIKSIRPQLLSPDTFDQGLGDQLQVLFEDPSIGVQLLVQLLSESPLFQPAEL